jgi:hypothetical protein
MKKCLHPNKVHELVLFKNNTRHIQIRCKDCDRKIGYARKEGVDLDSLPKGETTIAYRESVGLPTWCLGCGEDVHLQRTGVCGRCESKGIHRLLKSYAKSLGKTVWELSKEEIFEFHEREESIK